MTSCLVLGKPNVGKTLFSLRFAFFLGARVVRLARAGEERTWASEEMAARELVSDQPHQTLAVQRLALEIRARKGSRRFDLVDTGGLTDEIPASQAVREAQAETLGLLRQAGVILHMVDASRILSPGAVEAAGEVDAQLFRFGRTRGAYLILANKMDLDGATEGLGEVRRRFAGAPVVPLSARTGLGFGEVKRHVRRHL
ncbi:GTPase [Limnochorda pilosa]|uniref:G domain-containing protein n=1 Tax=Limnochorda pilosa TaxID=1555112 RepID=A0A0K2SKF6_LIMPI|nr:GTPase [Limnochorda pilosa]BAS27580.1 hypothetical protein LIP_1734 [Limnochorda pilosa]